MCDAAARKLVVAFDAQIEKWDGLNARLISMIDSLHNTAHQLASCRRTSLHLLPLGRRCPDAKERLEARLLELMSDDFSAIRVKLNSLKDCQRRMTLAHSQYASAIAKSEEDLASADVDRPPYSDVALWYRDILTHATERLALVSTVLARPDQLIDDPEGFAERARSHVADDAKSNTLSRVSQPARELCQFLGGK